MTGWTSSASTCASRARSSLSLTRSPPDGPLDILINNAAQTVRRSPDAYALLVAGEADALPQAPLVRELGAAHDLHPVTTLALTARCTAIDAGGLLPDEVDHNSWTQRVEEIDPVEMLEVQLCNTTAPFILISRLRASLAAPAARRTYIVNVSAMEGSFGRGYKGPGHPHTRPVDTLIAVSVTVEIPV